MSDDEQRVRINLRVNKKIKIAFDEEIRDTFGKLSPYAGIELERELQFFLDRGDIADLRTAVEKLDYRSGTPTREEKIRSLERSQTTAIGYRVAKNIREEIMAVSNKDFRSPGRLIESIMHRYVTEGSALQRLIKRLREISSGQTEDKSRTSVGAIERRTQTIAAQLSHPDRIAFDLPDFDRAVEAADGISPSKHVRETYIPRVLDELGFTWDPKNPGRFIDQEQHSLEDVRDPTTKPYYLMDRADKRAAIKLEAYRSTNGTRSGIIKVPDAVAALEGRPQRTTVNSMMREIATSSPGYKFRSNSGKMKIDPVLVIDNPTQNLDVIAVEHTIDGWVEKAARNVREFCEESGMDVDNIPDPVLENKIAKTRYPDLLDDTNREYRNAPKYITEEDRIRVLKEHERIAKTR